MFRAGQEIPLGPKTDIRVGDIIRLTGPQFCIDRTEHCLGGKAIKTALLPVVVAYFIGDRIMNMNSIICAGACAEGRNLTPRLNAVLKQSQTQVVGAPFPVSYAVTTVLALIGRYIAQIVS
ncbi:hypothetical protein KHP62_15665 [Rhodobacteraceae bacterium NNCM2]|nr:hypothetical protein [Coraliihabitans acroporae]